jgi:hypothetical protein
VIVIAPICDSSRALDSQIAPVIRAFDFGLNFLKTDLKKPYLFNDAYVNMDVTCSGKGAAKLVGA